MTTISFDTLTYGKKLIMKMEALKEIIDERLATKQDIRDLKRDMKEMESRLIIRLGALMAAMITASIGITVTLIKLIVH